MLTTEIYVHPKKGQTIRTKWAFWQERPFPDIGRGATLYWRNCEGIFPEYGNAARGIPAQYGVALLRSDLDVNQMENSRRDYAGYEGAPGTITLRGRDLGEMSFTVTPERPLGFTTVPWERFTRGERDFINTQIIPGLVATIEENKALLYRAAVDGIERTLADRLRETRERLNQMEREAERALKCLREKTV